jgi:hypothetical protein
MAAFLGIKYVRLEWATHEGIIKRDDAGKYHPETVTPAWLEYERGRSAKREHRSEFEQERIRLIKAKADREELRLAALNRSLVSTNDTIELVRTVALRIRNKMTACIPRLARACYSAPNPKEAISTARREFDGLLSELAALKPDRRRGQFEVVHDADTNGESRSKVG